MLEPTDTKNLAERHDPIEWSRAHDLLSIGSFGSPGKACILGTVRPDGRPHAAGVGGAFHDGDLYFQCGPQSRKARNVAANPACTMSLCLEGLDLTVEGDAERVTDPAVVEAVAAVYREGGWPVQAEGNTFTAPFNAPSAGPPPWHLYRVTIRTAFGVATAEPHGATRWRFAASS